MCVEINNVRERNYSLDHEKCSEISQFKSHHCLGINFTLKAVIIMAIETLGKRRQCILSQIMGVHVQAMHRGSMCIIMSGR